MNIRPIFHRLLSSILMFAYFFSLGVSPAAAAKGVPPGQFGITLIEAKDADGQPDSAIVKGTYMEYGLYKNGCFGTHKITKSEFNTTYGLHTPPSSSLTQLGFLADLGKDGWANGTPAQTGDMFVPGLPFEGWFINFGLIGTDYATGCIFGGFNRFAGLENGAILPIPNNFRGSTTFVATANNTISETTLPDWPGYLVTKVSQTVALPTSSGVKSDALVIDPLLYFPGGWDPHRYANGCEKPDRRYPDWAENGPLCGSRPDSTIYI